MRLLKAYVRMGTVDSVVRALQAAGAPGITIARAHGVGYDYDPELYSFAPGVEGKAPEVAKIEIVCAATEVDRLLQTVVQAAASGSRGDGIAFVTRVERAVKIRTGEEGAVALRG